MAEAKQLLDLKILFNRNTIRIEGDDYEILHQDEFGLTDFTWVRERSKKMFEILNKGEMSVDEAGQADTIISDLIKKIFVDLPDDTRKSIKTSDCVDIINAFFSQFTTREEKKKKME